MVYLLIRSDPILTPLKPKDRDKHLLKGFYGVDLPCQCPGEGTEQRSHTAKRASPCSFTGWEKWDGADWTPKELASVLGSGQSLRDASSDILELMCREPS